MPRRSATAADLVLEPGEAARRMRRFDRSLDYFATSYRKLLKKHPNSWVAIIDADVRATGSSLDEINERIRELGLPRSETLVYYIDDGHRILVV